MPVIIPFTFVGGPGNKAKASEVNADFQAIAAKFTEQPGGIADADVYSFADLNANKLSSTAGKRITAAKFEPGAVDSAALKAGTISPFADAAVNTSNHIKNGIVTWDKLKLRREEVSWGVTSLAVGATREVQSTFNPTTEALIDARFVVPSSLDDAEAASLSYWIWYTKTSPSSYTAHILAKNNTAGTLTFNPYPSGIFTYIQN